MLRQCLVVPSPRVSTQPDCPNNRIFWEVANLLHNLGEDCCEFRAFDVRDIYPIDLANLEV